VSASRPYGPCLTGRAAPYALDQRENEEQLDDSMHIASEWEHLYALNLSIFPNLQVRTFQYYRYPSRVCKQADLRETKV